MRSLCSEFPCDNPSLHYGATWVLLDTTGAAAFEANADSPPPAPTPLLVEEQPAELEPQTVEAPVAELRESGIFLAGGTCETPEEPQEETQPIVLAEVPAVSEPSQENLDDVDAFCMLLETVAVQFGGESAAEVVSSWLRDADSPMAEERAPWLALLRGGECDLSTATAATLDEWASKMLAKASGRDVGEIRRELRNRGLAAYGLLAA